MYVRRCASTYKRKDGVKTYEKWWIVESYKGKNDPYNKQKYLLDITELTPIQRENIKKFLKNPNSVAVMEEDLKEDFRRGIDYGQIIFFLHLMKKLGITSILSERLSKKSLSLIAAVLLNRILKPSSKMAAVQWIKKTSFVYCSSLEEKDYFHNRVYEAMDEVHKNMESIMDDFYHLSPEKPKFFLYDITSTYFEGDKVEMGKRGYSRDHRPDRPQVILGLVLSDQGLPIHFEVMKGNVKDSTTVKQTIKQIKKRFNLNKGTFIGDRGMINGDNVESIVDEGLGYIMALKHEEAKDLLKKKEIQTELFEKKTPITIFVDEKKKQYVLCGSEHRKKRDKETFHKILQKGRESLEEVQKMVEKGRIKEYEKVIRRAQKKLTTSGTEKYFDFKYEKGKFEIIEKKEEIKSTENLCGYYILETSETDMKAEDVELHYKELQKVERIFRDLKEHLDVRPVFHWKDRRVKTHIFLCILAQTILGHTRKCLKQIKWLNNEENTLGSFIDEISSIKLGKFTILGKEMHIVQKENPVENLLKKAFKLQPFEFEKDIKICGLN